MNYVKLFTIDGKGIYVRTDLITWFAQTDVGEVTLNLPNGTMKVRGEIQTIVDRISEANKGE